MSNRQPPNSLEAEEHLISAILLDNGETLTTAINRGISSSMFYTPANRIIFDCLMAMLRDGKAIDLSVLLNELTLSRQIDEVGGVNYLVQVSGRAPTTGQARYFADRVYDLAMIREAAREADALAEACYNYAGESPATVLDRPVSRLLALSTRSQNVSEPDWAQVVDDAGRVLESIITNQGLPAEMVVPFPWPPMNDAFNPMQRGQLVEIAARPSIGKSSLARPIAMHAAKLGLKVYFITLEVNPVQFALQMAASISGVGIRKVARAHVQDQADVKNALKGLRNYGITISRRDRSIARILGRARALHAKGMLDLLIVDHGLLVEDVAGAAPSEQRAVIGRLTKGLKTLATDLNIVSVLLWQLNRASAKEANREPNLTDLKDCGSLEEDADKVLFIHRPSVDGITGLKQDETRSAEDQPRFFQNIVQAKGRDDGTSIVSFYFDRATASFHPASRTN